MKKKSKSVGRTRSKAQSSLANRRGDHPSGETHKGSVAINNAGQSNGENQWSVASGGALAVYSGDEAHMKSDRKPRKNKRGQNSVDSQRANSSSGQANKMMNSKVSLPDHQLERDQALRVNHHATVSLRPAIRDSKPISVMQDDSFVGQSDRDNRIATANDASHDPSDIHKSSASVNFSNGHKPVESQISAAVTGDDYLGGENQCLAVIPTIRELWKNRQAWHRAEKSLTLQGKAQCRRFTEGDKDKANKLFASLEKMVGGDHIASDTQDQRIAAAISPFIEARTPLEAHRKLIEKELVKLAKSLPVYPWTKDIPGFGPLSLAAIVGCAGDLNNYATVSRLWKRMGLAVLNGVRQRKMKDAISALEHGFAPERAAVMFNIGGGLIGGMGHGPRPKVGEDVSQREDLSVYQKRFIELIRKEVTRVTETWNGPEHQRDPVEKKGELYESYSSHAANRIRRRIAKEFLCDLKVAWKALATISMAPKDAVPEPTLLEAAE